MTTGSDRMNCQRTDKASDSPAGVLRERVGTVKAGGVPIVQTPVFVIVVTQTPFKKNVDFQRISILHGKKTQTNLKEHLLSIKLSLLSAFSTLHSDSLP